NSELRRAQKEYFNNIFPENLNPKVMWSRLRELSNYKSKAVSPEEIIYNNKILRGDSMCYAFNNYFTNIALDLGQNTTDNFICYDNQLFNSFNALAPITAEDIKRYINKLSNSNAVGNDDIRTRSIKVASSALAPVLTYLINLSLTSGEFPDLLKIAKVIILHKKGDKNDPGNYRPISILPAFSKLYERAFYER